MDVREERRYQVRMAAEQSAVPFLAYAPEVIRLYKAEGSVPRRIQRRREEDPYVDLEQAKIWVETVVDEQVTEEVPLTCLHGIVRCGGTIIEGATRFAFDSDKEMHIWTYSLKDDKMVWVGPITPDLSSPGKTS